MGLHMCDNPRTKPPRPVDRSTLDRGMFHADAITLPRAHHAAVHPVGPHEPLDERQTQPLGAAPAELYRCTAQSTRLPTSGTCRSSVSIAARTSTSNAAGEVGATWADALRRAMATSNCSRMDCVSLTSNCNHVHIGKCLLLGRERALLVAGGLSATRLAVSSRCPDHV